MKCTNCGKEFESGMFCPNCGSKVETHDLVEIVPQQEDTYQTIETEQKSGKKNIGCIVAVIAVAIIVAFLILFIVFFLGFISSDKEDSAKEKKAQSATTETTEDPKQKAEKDDWLEVGQTYVLDDGLGSKLNVTINDVGTEDVMEYGTFGDYIEAVYLDCSFKNVGEEEEYINTDLFHFYADNQPVETDAANSMNMVSLSSERETSGLFYTFVNPDEVSVLEVEIGDKVLILKNSEGSVFDSTVGAAGSNGFDRNWYKSGSVYYQLGGDDWIDITASDVTDTFDISIDGTPYGSVDPDEYEYYEKYDMYLYTTSDDLQFCYMPSLQRIDVSSGVYSDEKFEKASE